MVYEGPGSGSGGDIAANDLNVGKAFLYPLDSVKHALGMSMGRIHHDHVHAGFGKCFRALLAAFADADGGSHA